MNPTPPTPPRTTEQPGAVKALTSCPFCGEHDYDLIGLKRHLTNGECEQFNETHWIHILPANTPTSP